MSAQVDVAPPMAPCPDVHLLVDDQNMWYKIEREWFDSCFEARAGSRITWQLSRKAHEEREELLGPWGCWDSFICDRMFNHARSGWYAGPQQFRVLGIGKLHLNTYRYDE